MELSSIKISKFVKAIGNFYIPSIRSMLRVYSFCFSKLVIRISIHPLVNIYVKVLSLKFLRTYIFKAI